MTIPRQVNRAGQTGFGARVTMEHYIWLFNRNDYKGLAGSFLVSLLFHVLLFAILATTSIYYPLTGETEKLDVVWLYPSFLLGGSTGPAEQAEVSPMKELATAPSRVPAAIVPPPAKVEPPQAAPAKAPGPVPERVSPPPPPPVSEAAVKPVVTAPPAEEPEPQEEPEMKIPAAIEPLPEVKAEEPRVEKPPVKNSTAPETQKAAAPEPKPAAEEPKKPAPPTKEAVAAKGVESTTPPAPKEAVRPASEKPEARPVAASRQQPAAAAVPSREKTVTADTPQPRERKEAATLPVPATQVTPALPKGEQRKTAAVVAAPALLPAGIPGEAKTVTVQKAAEPVPAAKPAPAVKADGEPHPKTAEVKGLFLPPISGDLKLEIVGKDDILRQIKVAVLFREFSKSRRARPLSRAEARRAQALTPKLARTGNSTQQAVIEVASEGVYEFTVETDSAQPVEVSFAVKLFDNSSRARTKPVGSRRIAHRQSIVKILMPEGILWTDDAAFSGSMEDSDSITKFNTDSGLVWKEYN